MQTSESRGGRGIGILILRHEDYPSQPPYEESSRMGLLGKNVKGMQPKEAGGKYIDSAGSQGDIMPALLWPKDSRGVPAHNWIWPAVVGGEGATPTTPSNAKVTSSGAGGTTQSGGTVKAMSRHSGNPQAQGNLNRQSIPTAQNKTVALSSESASMMLPVIGTFMHADTRFAPIGYATPLGENGEGPIWPRFAKGMYGLALPSTNEPQQENLLYPCDPRLIAVNNGNEPDMGSMVCDTNIDDESIDMERMARLQSAFRVIVKKDRRANSIALQLTFAENDDCEGGLVIDHHANDVIGRMSFLNGGPFDVGGFADVHQQSFDDDGNPINPLHLSLQSLFKSKFNRDMDGPLRHEGYWKGAQEAPIRTHVHFEWDADTQTHRWAGEAWMYKPNTPTGGPPTTGEPPPPDKPKPPPNEPTGGNPPPQGPPPGGVPQGKYPGTGPAPGGDGDWGFPDEPSGGSAGSGQGGDDVPWDPESGGASDGTPPGYPPGWGPKPPGFDDKVKNGQPGSPPKPQPGAGGGKGGGAAGKPGGQEGGGRIPVGPLPPGSDHPKWKNPDGSDPFWPFGWKKGKNGSEEKQKKRDQKKKDKEARRKAKKDKKKKGKKVGVIINEPPDREPEPPKVNGWGHIRWWGKPPRGGLGQYMRPMSPPPPNVFSPNIHPGGSSGGGGGSPTPITGLPSPGGTYKTGGRGPMPSGALPGVQFPPALVHEVMIPSLLARGQCFSFSAPDLRYDPAPRSIDIQAHDETAPISAHLQAYYAHGGAVGSKVGLGAANRPIYTQKPRTGRFWGGTAKGGFWITTPETDLADSYSNFNPQNVTQSTTYFGVAPQVYFGVGLPDLAQGGMTTGYRWGADRSGNAIFSRMNSSGVATDIIELGADGIVSVLPRGSGAGQGAQLTLVSPNGTDSLSFQAPDTTAADYVYVMPADAPIANDALSVASIVGDTITLEWAPAAGGGGLETLYATAVQTATTAVVTEETLQTYTIPAATMSADGDAVIVKAWGSFAANANVKTIRLRLGAAGTVLATNDITPSPNGGSWSIEAKIMYRNGVVQTNVAQATVGAVAQSVASTPTNNNAAGTIAVGVTGQNGTASAGDIICDGIEVESAPA